MHRKSSISASTILLKSNLLASKSISLTTPSYVWTSVLFTGSFSAFLKFLLEAKASRSDYLKDKNKLFRQMPELGMGDWRFYIAPRGLICKDELPVNWGLIEVNEKGKALTTYNPFGKGNMYYLWKRCKKSVNDERQMMYSALRRLHLLNRLPEIYEKN